MVLVHIEHYKIMKNMRVYLLRKEAFNNILLTKDIHQTLSLKIKRIMKTHFQLDLNIVLILDITMFHMMIILFGRSHLKMKRVMKFLDRMQIQMK